MTAFGEVDPGELPPRQFADSRLPAKVMSKKDRQFEQEMIDSLFYNSAKKKRKKNRKYKKKYQLTKSEKKGLTTNRQNKKSLKELVPSTKKLGKPWSAWIGGMLYPKNSYSSDHFIDYSTDLSYTFNPRHSIRYSQVITNNIIITEDYPKWDLWSSELNYYYRVTDPKVKDSFFRIRPSLIFPTSKLNQDSGVIVTPGLRLDWFFYFFDRQLTIALRPLATYNIARYSTKANGEPVSSYSLGHSLFVNWNISDNISLTSQLLTTYSYIKEEDLDAANDQSETPGKYTDLRKSNMEFEVDLGYQLTDKVSISAGFMMYDKTLEDEDGNFKLTLYDKTYVHYRLGIGYSF